MRLCVCGGRTDEVYWSSGTFPNFRKNFKKYSKRKEILEAVENSQRRVLMGCAGDTIDVIAENEKEQAMLYIYFPINKRQFLS
jgi:hypothetical protein